MLSVGVECKHAVDYDLLNYAKQEYGHSAFLLVDENYKTFVDVVCAHYSLQYPPTTHQDALYQFLVLKDECDSLATGDHYSMII